MKIALVHDYIKEYGGAERVLETLHDMFPHAPVYTLIYAPEFLGPHAERFASWHVIPSFLQLVPFKEKLLSPFRLIAPFVFQSFDFSDFDIILVSATGAYNPTILNKKQAQLLCYCHTPPRYLYGYATAREWKKHAVFKVLANLANHILRLVDFTASQNVDRYIANSENIKARIEKFYRKDAVVVYPPVDVLGKSGKKGDYYLAGGRLARPKHIDLIIQAANELKFPLKIFGKGFAGYGDELKLMAGPTVEFVGEISDDEKLKLMQGAKAFFFAGEDEDFGIVPVEAMGVGTPVIAYNSGGVKETVIDGKSGVFFNELTVGSLVKSVKKFEKLQIKPDSCITQAKKFDKKQFIAKIEKLIKERYARTSRS